MLTYLLISFAIFYATALCYVAVMHFKILKDKGILNQLNWSVKWLGYSIERSRNDCVVPRTTKRDTDHLAYQTVVLEQRGWLEA